MRTPIPLPLRSSPPAGPDERSDERTSGATRRRRACVDARHKIFGEFPPQPDLAPFYGLFLACLGRGKRHLEPVAEVPSKRVTRRTSSEAYATNNEDTPPRNNRSSSPQIDERIDEANTGPTASDVMVHQHFDSDGFLDPEDDEGKFLLDSCGTTAAGGRKRKGTGLERICKGMGVKLTIEIPPEAETRYILKRDYFDKVPANEVSIKSPVKDVSDEEWEALTALWVTPRHRNTCTKNKDSRAAVKFGQKTGSRSYLAHRMQLLIWKLRWLFLCQKVHRQGLQSLLLQRFLARKPSTALSEECLDFSQFQLKLNKPTSAVSAHVHDTEAQLRSREEANRMKRRFLPSWKKAARRRSKRQMKPHKLDVTRTTWSSSSGLRKVIGGLLT
ncbi:hypothetical protein QYE76_008933 [Lolium multiflorum]|uniref:Uncharacterized protein n=1 Tax=Lolium multiflorum TaxID=4521 RepID=A0AAD8X0R8_LOLMU|nr:hypothetical protein QYE76_008933 [Lolium multiflorum]